MSFSNAIFQKEIYNITKQDLEIFFSTEQEENAVLEFKSGETSFEDVYKEVAAFLNTEGGLLIIGAPRESKRENDLKMKVCKGALTPCTKILSKDTLTRSIAGNIMPSPTAIRIQEIYIEGGSVYILEIPQSMTPPHQVTEKGIYYIRLERDAKAAPHGVVEALFRKRDMPALTTRIELFAADQMLLANSCCICIFLHNESYVSAENVGWELEIKGISRIYPGKTIGQTQFKHNAVYCSEQELGRIFVNGLEKRLNIEIQHNQSYVYLSFTYYCKDLRAEKLNAIIQGNKIIESYHSRESGIRNNDLYNQYETLRKNEWLKLLPDPEPLPATYTNPLYAAEYVSHVPISEELYEFYSIYNGLNRTINGYNVQLYQLEQLFNSRTIDPGFIKGIATSSRIYQIGTVNADQDILMVLKDDNTFSFGRINNNKRGSYALGDYFKDADSLYDFLQTFQHKKHL
ncbi:ATP-binding protein [Chitinophaga sp. G-6-1-13]|uniref:ATP-binding protein n=1 Tax=Chitinophaga fulva TaxID=2728842 RepID=A0A848GJR4_9BACT|nr:ATP-binding protein [Chitinophaga fulva]NML38127.1 ATP-binding protein [Chitinophaga fulva]